MKGQKKDEKNGTGFGDHFLVGAATSAHQVEGNNINSDYWAMEHMETAGFREPSLDAVDHYHRYEEDIRLMAEAGLDAYRFSIEWARIEPQRGYYDEAEIEHYRKVLLCCHENHIEPVVTMLHFSSPKWLIEQGGWEAEETVGLFASYCGYVAEKLGDLMGYVCTINEANMGLQIAAIAERYKRQMMAGTAQVGMDFEAMMANMQRQKQESRQVFGTETPQSFVSSRTPEGDILIMRAHQAAREAMKAVNPKLRIGITLSLHDIQPMEGCGEAAERAWEEEFTHYMPYIRDDDFFGLQNYTRSLIGLEGVMPNPEDAELTQMGYEYYPEALEHVIRRVSECFCRAKGCEMPIMVTENGIATGDDERRGAFIQAAFTGVKNCIADGMPVLGYFYWFLLDNFEWQRGYFMTFGLIGVDRSTQKRIPRQSLYRLGSYAKEVSL